MKRKKLWLFLLFLAFIYLNNTSLFIKPTAGKPILLAHRGLAQTFSTEGVTGRTNTAARIYQPEHPFLENTIASMDTAFALGAAIVEFDIHPTTDGKFAVFHDDVLDYRTNATGETEKHTLMELQLLDIGFGYTADGGKSYPFRGKGIGLMPSLDEVLAHFPERSFLIHIKSSEAIVGTQLATYLEKLPKERLSLLTIYGADDPVGALKKRMPYMRASSKTTMKKAILQYVAMGWTGYVPSSLRNTQISLPLEYAPYLWGWPYRFLNRMKGANTRIILIRSNGKFADGFDNVTDIKELPPNYTGGIWTNRIDRISPLFR